MKVKVANKYVTLKTHIEGIPKEFDFQLKTAPLNLYVSIDLYRLTRVMHYNSSHKTDTSFEGITLGEEIEAYGATKVVASDNVEFQKGDLVVGVVTWAEYSKIRRNRMIRKLDPLGFPLSYYVGIYTKLHGCYVVDCAGRKRKVQLLKDKLGFDAAFIYREETNLNSTLKRKIESFFLCLSLSIDEFFRAGIDISFESVGAERQEAVVASMNTFGRVAMCGVISDYTDSGEKAAPDILDDFVSTTSSHLLSGELCPLENISDGLDSIPCAFTGLFHGDNIGKKIVKITEE
ncbi:hypothetical protein ACJRO7_014265 [Eucalyptus globulus]|uniref:Oxidoreductase N-terminal domain-containing protein n=1 Tax=Eucalyptus globulus TaxID=34317 RepID=A0ABD3L0P3_EUCGL